MNLDAGTLALLACIVFGATWYLLSTNIIDRIWRRLEKRISSEMIRRSRVPRDRSKPPRL